MQNTINSKCQIHNFYLALIFNAKLKLIIWDHTKCFNAIFMNFLVGIFDLKFWHKVMIPGQRAHDGKKYQHYCSFQIQSIFLLVDVMDNLLKKLYFDVAAHQSNRNNPIQVQNKILRVKHSDRHCLLQLQHKTLHAFGVSFGNIKSYFEF